MPDPAALTYKELCKEYDPIIDEPIVLAQPEDPTTFLNIDTELLIAAKELAEREHKTAGQIVSELLRQALRARAGQGRTKQQSGKDNYGFQPVPSRGGVVTNQHINRLRDEFGDGHLSAGAGC